MKHAILPSARPSPSRGSADGSANSFGFRKKAIKKGIKVKKKPLPAAKLFKRWDN